MTPHRLAVFPVYAIPLTLMFSRLRPRTTPRHMKYMASAEAPTARSAAAIGSSFTAKGHQRPTCESSCPLARPTEFDQAFSLLSAPLVDSFLSCRRPRLRVALPAQPLR